MNLFREYTGICASETSVIHMPVCLFQTVLFGDWEDKEE
jgi:hypothetical protein